MLNQYEMKAIKALILFIIVSVTPLLVQAQTPELKGDVIGSTYSADYSVSGGVSSTTVNTKNLVFDNDLNTFFAAYDRSGGWVGLDLGTTHVIKSVSFAPRAGYASRMLLGVIEGANKADFGDAIPLYIIKQTPESAKMTTVEVSCSRAFRYVRYVGPNDVRCNIAELHFYGEEGSGDDSHLYQLTNIPTVVIHTVNNQDITSKETYIQGIVSFISHNGAKIYSDSLNIRGRGNASWEFPKKPYKIKLYNSHKLLDFPAKAKNWTLVNNWGDKTLLRNLVAFEISRRFGMAYTPAGTAVDVILNGEYKGCYQLCDQVEVRKNRVDITEMTPQDIAYPAISGGYMLEVDGYAYKEKSWFASSMKKIPVTIKTPDEDEIVPEQTSYIQSYFNKLESTVFSSIYNDPSSGYRSLLDLDTFIKHLLIGELTGNTDTYWSMHMTKDRNQDKFFVGPEWDFDIGFDNDYRTYPINQKSDFLYRSGGSCVTGMLDFANRIVDSSAAEQKAIWSEARNHGGINAASLLAYVDSVAADISQSRELNFMRWNILNTRVHMNPMVYGSYEGELNALKNFLSTRVAWMDKKVGLTVETANESMAAIQTKIDAVSGGVRLSECTSGDRIVVYNLLGQMMTTTKLNGADLFIPLSRGIYFIVLHQADGKIASKKVSIR